MDRVNGLPLLLPTICHAPRGRVDRGRGPCGTLPASDIPSARHWPADA